MTDDKKKEYPRSYPIPLAGRRIEVVRPVEPSKASELQKPKVEHHYIRHAFKWGFGRLYRHFANGPLIFYIMFLVSLLIIWVRMPK